MARPAGCSCTILGLTLALVVTVPAYAWHDIGDIESAAIDAARQITAPAEHRSMPTAEVDPNLRLAVCDVPLQARADAYRAGARRVMVQVDCVGQARWRVWVPVFVQLRVPVVVARRALSRSELLAVEDLTVIKRDVDGGRQYASDPVTLVGRRTRSEIPAGEVVSLANTTAEQLIKRGQRVTLVTVASGLRVTSQGIAQSDGAMGTRIRVRNLTSDRLIEGVVRSSELVEILFNSSERG